MENTRYTVDYIQDREPFWTRLMTLFYCFLLPLLCSGKGYSSRASSLNQSDLLLSGGSVGQLTAGGGALYLPDYSVRQLTDLQIIKVTQIKTKQHGNV